MAVEDIHAVRIYRELVQQLLDRAADLKRTSVIDPPITEAHFVEGIWPTEIGEGDTPKSPSSQASYAAVEIAFREKFYHLLATTSINEPNFVHVWNLLDIVSIYSDNERCEPGLIFWLIEELLDSQTIDGCRKVFDYLESRRERNTAKHFQQKSLIILRSCNELLRRLSRAEDTVFCGRVFIFLFQSFPLGDKSSVNLRGEYHTENVTTFDQLPTVTSDEDVMEVDAHGPEVSKKLRDTENQATEVHSNPALAATVTSPDEDTPVDMDSLYPVFWGLQANFSAPTHLFETGNFASFRNGLEATVSSFQRVSIELEKRGMTKGSEESSRRGSKRKRAENVTEAASSFNPKYLTSRDLFELEANDIAFRRHILVQSLIILDFLISLTPKAKAKLTGATNKSVLYGYVLSDEDVSRFSSLVFGHLLTPTKARWATKMKSTISTYLQQGIDGKFYYRMVDTVLTRDKNWVRWKADGCPSIERPSIQAQEYIDAQSTAVKLSSNKRLRATPLGSLNLQFLSPNADQDGLDRLKATERFTNPEAESYVRGIADDDFNLDMAQNDEDKEEAARSKASKSWRVLRLSSRSKLNLFDKIEDGKSLGQLFENPPSPQRQPADAEDKVSSPKEEELAKDDAKENEVMHE
ncbi:hypothetical protein LOZ12_005332 [Ophidiomyces ophidiicola]|uniref:Uncharacterized protein n=1 Tax=Ophidiomyces ophidiicola TaxID=1387563 RepID=A0ACB8UQD7_9EURO|nr:hypothetical protein LOZ64_005275 [Ophidiomyces ophidiicola]KAI1910417.1 hypothetical protein LOZ61_004432 [Ophidiomyces ophidiicola]KAI1922460.1 hypothetical protein LOZ60_005684 [Ophidiomyces ophidiicola]KAI1937354.1 hypothetical protein LOZ62_005516 [Ophidiomyces ophidiicola]KAI1950866.1 hypothetical protein LOZ59_005712 [Ophidiomyces ophidiicola]